MYQIFSISLLPYADYVMLALRIVLGITLVYYGLPKVKDLKSNGEDFVKMGFKPGIFWGTIIALVEFLGGILIIIGLLTGFIALLVAIEMAMGAIWKVVKTDKPFSDWSYDLLILILALVLMTYGAGNLILKL